MLEILIMTMILLAYKEIYSLYSWVTPPPLPLFYIIQVSILVSCKGQSKKTSSKLNFPSKYLIIHFKF